MSQDVPASAIADAPLTLREAASFLKCSQRTIQRLVARGFLTAYLVGRNRRFFRRDLLKAMQPVVGAAV